MAWDNPAVDGLAETIKKIDAAAKKEPEMLTFRIPEELREYYDGAEYIDSPDYRIPPEHRQLLFPNG